MASDGGGGGGEVSLASDPDFAAVCSFLQVFGSSCALEPPSISDLQLKLEDTQEVSEVLRDLHLKLLRRALKSVQPERWERSLIKFCHQLGLHKEAWELERFTYKKSSARVKLTVLKVLLEYQFTCHVKFKNGVNTRSSCELRLEPVGRDRAGRVYWLHTDCEANLRLYREDQDEETWSLIARDREGLLKVINQLKSGEESATVSDAALNEDSNSLETPPSTEKKKTEENEDSNEEFLSPESESDHESDLTENKHDKEKTTTSVIDCKPKEDLDLQESSSISVSKDKKDLSETQIKPKCDNKDDSEQKEDIKTSSDSVESTDDVCKNEKDDGIKNESEKLSENTADEEVGPAIEEPVMLVTGEGNGADCESIDDGMWDEISDPIMYVWGVGCGADCDTGNPGEIATKDKCENTINDDPTANEHGNKNDLSNIDAANNGGVSSDVDSNTSSSKKETNVENSAEKNEHLSPHQSVTKRLLQENYQVSESKPVESTHKKPCIWNVESIVRKAESSNDACSEKKTSEIGNAKDIDEIDKSENNGCSEDEKPLTSKLEINPCEDKCKDEKESNNIEISENETKDGISINSPDDEKTTNSEQSDKKNIVEKRKSSLSSEDDKRNKVSESDKNILPSNKKQTGKHKTKLRAKGGAKTVCKPDVESLPPKKLRLDSSTDDCDKEASEKCTVVDGPSRKTEKDEQSDHESHVNQKNNVSNCSGDERIANKLDDSGIVPKKCKVEDVSNSIDKKDSKYVEVAEKSRESKEQTPQRVTKKVGRGKFRRRLLKRPVDKPTEAPADSDSDKNLEEIANKHKEETSNGATVENAVLEKSPSLKRGLQSDKRKRTRNKVESVSEEENEAEVMGKRLKIKPRKILLSSRKKVEAKLNNLKDSSEDSEEAEVTPKKGKSKRTSSPKKESKEKSSKKIKKKQGSEGKKKKTDVSSAAAEGDDATPVRQSRRIAQLKIREEAERRQMEEVALRELKIRHKKKMAGDGEEEWKAPSCSSGSEAEQVGRRRDKWPPSDSSAPASESDSDEPLFEREYEEPDLVFKSDHEFSPESDLEDDETAEPLKRARTLKEETDGFCVRCGRGDHPEWILLCDDCDAGYHASCLKPVLFLVPDGDWYCPPCQHQRLIKALEAELVKYDVLAKVADTEMQKRKSLELAKKEEEEKEKKSEAEGSEESSSDWSSSDEGTVYRLRERRQLPVSLRAQEYDRLMSSAIKEEYKEPSSTAGNQGRGKDISTIIEAAAEEKQKAEMEAAQQSGAAEGGVEVKRSKLRRPRRKPRKLNSLDVPSEDDDETDEDFKETGWESSSESISSDAEDGNTDSRSSDSLPIRRSGREAKKSRKKLVESPELKKKKGVFDETSSESSGAKDWSEKKNSSTKKKHNRSFPKKVKKKKGLKQYDAEGNVIKARVKYGGLSGSEGSNDWSPKHRTRQKKINYTEMPNTESEDEMHKPTGKHMPDSSDEFKLDTDDSSDSESERRRKRKPSSEEREPEGLDDSKVNTLRDLIKKTAVVPLHKLPEEVTKAKTEALEAQLNAKVEAVVGTATPSRPSRGKGSRGGRGSRGPRGGRGGGRTPSTSGAAEDGSSNLVGLKIKDLSQNIESPLKPNQIERERKRQEREAKQAEKEARKLDRLKKKEEKDQMKEQKAKEREEKRLAKVALMESKKQRKEKFDALPVPIPIAGYGSPAAGPPGARPHHDMQRMPMNINQQFAEFQRMRHPGAYEAGGGGPRGPAEGAPPRLQVRPELSAMRPDLANVRAPPPHGPAQYHHPPPHHMMQRDAERRGEAAMRDGTLSVAGSPQPYKPATDPPSIITRMPHMMPSQYRGPAMYVGGSPYGPPPHGARPPVMYMHQPHPLDPSPSGGGPINVNNRPFPGGYYPRGYPAPRFPAEPVHHSPTPPPADSQPKIKSEIKTEPEATSSPSSSPARLSSPSMDEPARIHPKMKHTESKERARTTAAARYPHGPYAPQYGPYGPYAPPAPDGYAGPMHSMQVPPRPLHSTPPPGAHPAHRMPPHHPGQPPPTHHGPPVSHHSAPHHHGPPPLRHGPPPHHLPLSNPVRSHLPHPHHPGLAAHQSHPTGPPGHQQHPTGMSTHQLHQPNVSAHKQHPPSVSAHQPHQPNVSAHQSHPLNTSTHQSHPPSVSTHQSHPPSVSTHQSHQPSVSTHQSHQPSVSTHQSHQPNVSAHQSHPLNASTHQTHPPNVSAHQSHPLNAHQPLPPNVSTHQPLPPNVSSHQPPPTNTSIRQSHPPNASPHQSLPPGAPSHQPHPPTSPHNALQSTPPPVLPRRPPEVLHHAPKIPIQPATDSVNLVAHNRLQATPPPVIQRVSAQNLHPTPEPESDAPSHPIALKVSSAPSNVHLTPMEAASKVTLLDTLGNGEGATSAEESGCDPRSPPMNESATEGGVATVAVAAREEEGGVFGGLVSYFSSQHEDGIDG